MLRRRKSQGQSASPRQPGGAGADLAAWRRWAPWRAVPRQDTGTERRLALLHATLEHMDHGLLVIDAAGQVALCNARAVALLGLVDQVLVTTYGYATLRQAWATEWGQAVPRDLPFIAAGLGAGTGQARELVQEWRHPNGRMLEIRSALLPDGGTVSTYADITERKRLEERLSYAAMHDDLTGLPNRVALNDMLADRIADAGRTGQSFAVLYLDLDRFKQVNDLRGHDVGDQVLVLAGRRMQMELRQGDMVARLGGDEFAAVLTSCHVVAKARLVADRMLEALSQPFVIDGEASHIGVSIGIAMFDDSVTSPEELLRRADIALYRAKAAGRNTVFCSDY